LYDEQMKERFLNSNILWFFKRQDGSQGVAQPPNLPIGIAIVAWLAMRLIPDAPVALTVIIDMSFIVWGWAEVYNGVSGFRKLLGLTVLLSIVAGYL